MDDRAVGTSAARLRAFVRDALAQRLVLAGLCARALWARAQPARPFALSGVYRTCHRNFALKFAPCKPKGAPRDEKPPCR